MKEKMGEHDSVSTLFLAGISAVICVESIRLGPGSFSNPGSGLFPLLCAAVLGILSLLSFFLSQKRPITEVKEFMEVKPKQNIVLVITSMFIYTFLIQISGFRLITILWMLFVCRAVAGMEWKASIGMSLIVSFAFYFLFSTLLSVHFPRGLFGF